MGEIPTLNDWSLAKSFHRTISKDWTDQEAVEGQRLVALQEKLELDIPLDLPPESPPSTAPSSLARPPMNWLDSPQSLQSPQHTLSIVKFKQSFVYI